MKYTWINGSFKESSRAVIGVGDLAIQRGFGVFDFFRCNQGKPFLLPHYLDRFYNSASELNLRVPMAKDDLSAVIDLFIKKNKLQNEGIKIILTGGYSPDGYHPIEPNLIISGHKIAPPEPEKYQNGFKVFTFPYQRESPSIKSINYLQGIKLIPTLTQKGYDDVLYYSDEIISELPRSNLFVVDHQEHLLTPARNILKGITRKTVLHLSKGHFSPVERDVTLSELKKAKEVFLTSTTKRIIPICEIDHQPVGNGKPGAVCQYLSNAIARLPSDYILPNEVD